MDTQMVDVASVRPNKWNYNAETPATFQKVVESIRKYGFSDPVVVRVTGAPGYEIVNGEHRWRAAVELGMKQIPVFSLGKVDDARAKQLCVTLNELGGTSDEVRLAQLLRDISATYDPATSLVELEKVMPFSGNEIKQMLESVDFSFSKLSREDTRDKTTAKPKGPPKPKGGKVKTMKVPITVVPSRLAAVHADPARALWALLEWWDTREEEATP